MRYMEMIVLSIRDISPVRLFRSFVVPTVLVVSFVMGSVMVAGAAATTVKKPVEGPIVVKGTTQLPGPDATIGKTYTIGKADPINFTVRSAEFTVGQTRFGSNLAIPDASEKVLVLHYTLQNPNKYDRNIGWSTLAFTVVDGTNTNCKYTGDVAVEATGLLCNQSLKPGQKVDLYVAFIVPAAGPVPKLMVESGDRFVLRYNLAPQGKPLKAVVKPLAPPVADPADKFGSTALGEVPAQLGVFYDVTSWDVKVESMAFSDTDPSGKALAEGARYLHILATVRNATPGNNSIAWSTFSLAMSDQDSYPVPWNQRALAPTRDLSLNINVEKQKEVRLRWTFEVPKGTLPQKVTLKSGQDDRAYAYDCTGLK